MSGWKIIKENTVIRASVLVAVITLLIKLLGYIEKITVAYYWGTNREADVYTAVFSILIGISIFFREWLEPGFLNTTLRQRSSTGEKGSWATFRSLFCFVGSVALLLSAICFGWPEQATKLFLSGFTGEKMEIANRFFRIGSIGLFFLIIATVTHTYLSSYKYFTAQAFSEFCFKSIILLSIPMLHRHGIYALIWGLVFGAIGKFAIQFFRLRKHLYFRDLEPDPKIVRSILTISLPLLVGNLFSQIGNIVDNTFASYLDEGAVSGLSYAKKIIDLPVMLFPYTLSIVIFPFFSELAIEKNQVRLNRLLNISLKYILLFFVPLTVLIAFFSPEITRLFFERGAFDASSTNLTSGALSTYNWGMVAFALEAVLVIFLFSQGRIKLPVVLGIATVMLDILITWMLIGKWGFQAIAGALVISKWVKAVLLFFFTRSGFWLTVTPRRVFRFLLALLSFSIPLLLFETFGFLESGGFIVLGGKLLLVTVVAFGVYVLLLIHWKLITSEDARTS